MYVMYAVLELSNLSKLPLTYGVEAQLLQIEVQFPGVPMVQKPNRTFAPAFQDESHLPTFRIAFAIGEHYSRT